MLRWLPKSKLTAWQRRGIWAGACLLFPFVANFAYGLFPIGCKCPRGTGTMYEFGWIVSVLWARLGIGLILGEVPIKIPTYFVLLFAMTEVTVLVFDSVMPH
jgi:hypothetical protein